MTTETEKAMAKTIKPKAPATMVGLKSSGVQDLLDQMKPAIARALPKHLTPERMIQMAVTLIVQNPAIAKCSTASIIGAVMQASILGFKPVAALGHCYFVPYGKDVQFQIGYKGYIDLSRRSGELKEVYAEVVREGDTFIQKKGLHRDLIHEPDSRQDGELTHVYAVAHYMNGGYNFIVLTKKDVEKLRMRSPMQGLKAKGTWEKDTEAMWRAKAIKQLSKYMPLSDEFQKAVVSDEAVLTPETFSADGTGVKEEELNYELTPVEDQGAAEVVDEGTGEITPKEEPVVKEKPAEEKPPPPPEPDKAEIPTANKPKARTRKVVEKPKAEKPEKVAAPPEQSEIPKDAKRKILQNTKGGVTIEIEGGPTYDASYEDYKLLIAGKVTDNDLLDKDMLNE